MAQGSVFDDHGREIEWPAGGFMAGQHPHDMVTGEFTGDRQPDAVLLEGTQPVLVYGPKLYRVLIPIPRTANGIAVAPGATGGDPDRLILVNSAGVEFLHEYGGTSVFQSAATLTDSQWQGALDVEATDFAGLGDIDLFGVGSSGSDIVVTLDSLGTPTTSQFSVGSTIFDIGTMDYDGDQLPEIATIHASGVSIYESTGTLIGFFGGTLATGSFSAFTHDGLGYDRGAVVYNSYGTDWITVLDQNLMESPVDLGPVGAHASACGETNGDPAGDFLVSHRATNQPILFFNQALGVPIGSVPTFDLNSLELVDLGPLAAPTANQQSTPVLADLGLDGDTDLLFYSEPADSMFVMENSTVDETNHHLTIDQQEDIDYVHDLTAGTSSLSFDVIDPNQRAEEVEIVVWARTPTFEDPGGYEYDQLASSEAVVSVTETLGSLGTGTVVIPLQGAFIDQSQIYYIELRPLVIDPAQVRYQTRPTTVIAFALDSDFVFQALNESEGGALIGDLETTLSTYPPPPPTPFENDKKLTPGIVETYEVPIEDDPNPDPDPGMGMGS